MSKMCGCRSSIRTSFWASLHLRALTLITFISISLVEFAQPVYMKGVQKFAIEPNDKTAILGDSVVLPCRVLNMIGMLQWTRDDFALGVDRALTGYPRYKMIGSNEEGDFSLLISQVSLEDDAVFQCQVGATMADKGIRSRKAKLVVFVPPQPPIIEQGSFLKTVSGTKEELTCISNGGKPAAELHWLDGQGFEMKVGIQHIKSIREDGKTFNSKLKLTFIPSRAHHNTTLTCRSENPALKRSMLAKIHIEVRFPPDVRLMVKSGTIREPQDVKFLCLARANPEKVKYKWYKNGIPIIGDYTTEYILRSVSRRDNKMTVTCEVANSVGSTTSMHVLDVHYRPIIQEKGTYLTADYKSSVTLKCPANGNPKPLITWSHEDKIMFQGSRQNLAIKNMNKYKTGRYKCNATVPGFPSATQDYLVFIRGPPKIKSESKQIGIIGHTIKLECLVRSVPLPSNVAWYYRSTLIAPYTDRRYDIEEDMLADGVRNQLIIHRSTEKDFGTYNCSVTNTYGSDGLEIILAQPDNLSEQLPWIGIVAGVSGGIVLIVTASIIVIFFLRYKDGKRKENLQVDLKHELPSSCKMQRNETEPKVLNDTYRNSTVRESSELNGYVPYSDYTKDYIPTHADGIPHHHMNNLREDIYTTDKIDPWFNAGYANPYLSRNSVIGPLGPPPHSIICKPVSAANSMSSPATTTTTTVSALSKNQHIVANNENNLANFDQQSPTTHV